MEVRTRTGRRRVVSLGCGHHAWLLRADRLTGHGTQARVYSTARVYYEHAPACPLGQTRSYKIYLNNPLVLTWARRFSMTNSRSAYYWKTSCCHTMASQRGARLRAFLYSRALRRRSFDRTEFEEPFVPSNATHLPPIEYGSRVLFRGVVSILALTHLSGKGIQYLNRDFKERVVGSGFNGIVSARKYSSSNLESIFGLKAKQKQLPKAEQYEVRVLIQGFMRSTASFMRCQSSTSIRLYPELMHLQPMSFRMGCCSIQQILRGLSDESLTLLVLCR